MRVETGNNKSITLTSETLSDVFLLGKLVARIAGSYSTTTDNGAIRVTVPVDELVKKAAG